jgi:uncharacterized protein
MALLSQYCHPFLKGEILILFHSLLFHQIVLNSKDVKFSKKNGTFQITNPEKADTIIEAMAQKKMLIDKPDDDLALLDSFKKLIEKPYISTAYFFLTNNCNLACKYCFEKQSVPDLFRKETMSVSTFSKGLDFYVRLIKRNPEKFNQKKTIIFYGGEPMQNKIVLFSAINQINEYKQTGKLPADTNIIAVTNGTLLTDYDIDFFSKNNITLTFSIDGNRAACSNRVFQSGKEVFDVLTKKYLACKGAGININIACTLTPQTLKNATSSLDYFIHDLKINNIGFNAILDNGIIKLSNDYDQEAADFIVNAWKKLSKHNITESRMGRRLQVFARKKPCIFDCNAQGGRQIAIAPGGEVGICHEHIADRKHFVTHISEDFAPEENPVFIEWMNRSPLNIKKCHSCPALGLCGGGCVINTENTHKTIWEPDPRFCTQTLTILKYLLAN